MAISGWQERTYRWKREATSFRPSPYAPYTHGVSYAPSWGNVTSPPNRISPPPITGCV